MIALVALVAFAAGTGATLGFGWLRDWDRTRKLREVIHWMGEDLEARKLAEQRAEHRIHVMRGQLP